MCNGIRLDLVVVAVVVDAVPADDVVVDQALEERHWSRMAVLRFFPLLSERCPGTDCLHIPAAAAAVDSAAVHLFDLVCPANRKDW